MAYDDFGPQLTNSLPLAYVAARRRAAVVHRVAARGRQREVCRHRRAVSLKWTSPEHTFDLENSDAAGVNNRGCYKNVPFYLSSRPTGCSSTRRTHVRLSLADLSTRAAMTAAEDGRDGPVLHRRRQRRADRVHYRRLTGFPFAAAAVVLRHVDEPHDVFLGRRGAPGAPGGCAKAVPLRRAARRYRLVRDRLAVHVALRRASSPTRPSSSGLGTQGRRGSGERCRWVRSDVVRAPGGRCRASCPGDAPGAAPSPRCARPRR